MLAALGGGTEHVDAQVFGVEVHLGGALHLGHHLDQGEGGVAGVGGVEGGEAHQAVHPALGPQVAVGVAAGDLHSNALDAGLLARSHVQDGGAAAALLGPAQVHAQQHLRPVLGVGAARAGVDGQDGVPAVVLAGEGQRQLHLLQSGGQLVDVGGHGGGEGFVVLRLGQVEQLQGLAGLSLRTAPGLHLLPGVGQAAHHLLRLVGVVPEAGAGGLPLQLLDL